jgi:DNA mismatch repair protein MutL
MDPRIHILPSDLANQIAAGEVVERPASAVKKLVENSLDAGARRIDVDVEGGGRRLLRVVDDGQGMTAAEAALSLKRHATSKLACLEDLFSIGTMGFRGEALPSIAAVSRLELVTRVPEALAGHRLSVEAGVEREAHDTGAPAGTQIAVRDLLYNVPARLKFMKSESTEAAHITEAVTRLALAHPNVHFRLRHGGRIAIDLPPHATLIERVRAVLGRRLGARLVEGVFEESGVRVQVFLCPPDEAQTTSRGMQLYVGRRFVRDRGLLHAVGMGYGELIPSGRYATAIVFVDPPAGAVDVNVHPQKIEVRFARPQEVYAAVRHAVGHTVARAPWLDERASATTAPVTMYAVASHAPPSERLSDVGAAYANYQERLFTGKPTSKSELRLPATRSFAPRVAATENVAPAPAPEARRFFAQLSYLGQLDRTYLVCEAYGELVLVDQHAAHERIAFERLREAYAAKRVPTQRMLFPATLDLDDVRAAIAADAKDALAAIGYEIEPLSGRTWAIKAAPAELRDDEIAETLEELLGDLAEHEAEGTSRALEDRLDAVFATVACHSVVRAGDVLGAEEARALLASLDDVDFKAHCPHGRPVLLRLSVAEIARRFGRT